MGFGRAWHSAIAWGFLAAAAIALLVGAGGLLFRGGARGPTTVVRGQVAYTEHAPVVVFGGGELVAEATLPVTNPWDREVYFREITTSCGCSEAKLLEEHLRPGGQGRLHVVVRLAPVGGAKRISCTLGAVTGERSVHNVTVIGYPHVQLDSELDSISFGKALPNKGVAISRRLFLNARGDESPARILAVTADSQALTADVAAQAGFEDLPDGVGRRGQGTLNLHLSPGERPGFFATSVAIEYDGPAGPGRLSLPVLWEVGSIISARPARVFVTVPEGNQETLERTVRLKAVDGHAFTVRSVETGAGWAEVAAPTPESAAIEHEVSLRLHPGAAKEKDLAEVAIVTDHPRQPRVVLPVAVFRQRGVDDSVRGLRDNPKEAVGSASP